MEWWFRESGDVVGIPNWPHGPYLEQQEVLRRVAAAFRRVVIDWTEGDRWVEARIIAATEVGSNVLDLEYALRGRAVLVSVADAAEPDAAWVRFYVTPDTELFELHYEPPGAEESCRALARKLAEVLGYEFETYEETLAEEGEDLPSDVLIHQDLLPDAEGILPTAKGCLPTEELLSRVANRFPLAVIDRERGDRIIRAGADKRAEPVGSPTDPSVERQLALVGRVAYVTVRDAVGGPQFCFFLTPNPTCIRIEYERPQDREACRPLLKALVAELVDYYHITEDPEPENPDD